MSTSFDKEYKNSHSQLIVGVYYMVRLAAHVSNGLKSRIRPVVGRIRLQHKPKSNNYTKSDMIDEADIWRGRNVWYLGRSVS